jgi:hypothetical protein
MDGGGSIPVYRPPRKRRPRSTLTSTASTAPKSGTSGGGKTPQDPYAAAQAAANRKERKLQAKAANRYIKQAQSMQGQIAALKNSLSEGFMQALNQRLTNIGLVQGQQDDVLMEGYQQRVKSLEGSAADNEKAAAGGTFQNLTNRGRERANAITEALSQGAGESDVLKSQSMSLRNWGQNQQDIERSYFDSLRSINSSLTDLNVDTKTARINLASQANADRDQVWSQYYDQRSETLTQLGNLHGQQGELYGMAQEQVGNKRTRRRRRQAVRRSDANFMAASEANAHVWQNPGVDASLMNWQGEGEIQGVNNASILANAAVAEPVVRPEGATLRKWTT